jgi:hypothetical protein
MKVFRDGSRRAVSPLPDHVQCAMASSYALALRMLGTVRPNLRDPRSVLMAITWRHLARSAGMLRGPDAQLRRRAWGAMLSDLSRPTTVSG